MSKAEFDDPLRFSVYDPSIKALSPADLQALPKGAVVTSVDFSTRSFTYSVRDPHPLCINFGPNNGPSPKPLRINVFKRMSGPKEIFKK